MGPLWGGVVFVRTWNCFGWVEGFVILEKVSFFDSSFSSSPSKEGESEDQSTKEINRIGRVVDAIEKKISEIEQELDGIEKV